eukprot:GHVT01013606.1.p1 GENE.GHVT01013606.1~~GHVT01013606.1.p1  ORF type:complete len:271 (+),score=26.18 GHVT01013606.1:1599-2411(+)
MFEWLCGKKNGLVDGVTSGQEYEAVEHSDNVLTSGDGNEVIELKDVSRENRKKANTKLTKKPDKSKAPTKTPVEKKPGKNEAPEETPEKKTPGKSKAPEETPEEIRYPAKAVAIQAFGKFIAMNLHSTDYDVMLETKPIESFLEHCFNEGFPKKGVAFLPTIDAEKIKFNVRLYKWTWAKTYYTLINNGKRASEGSNEFTIDNDVAVNLYWQTFAIVDRLVTVISTITSNAVMKPTQEKLGNRDLCRDGLMVCWKSLISFKPEEEARGEE